MQVENIRRDIIKTISIKGGLPAVNLSSADIFAALYFNTIKHNPRQPKWEERDRVFVSDKLTPAWQTTLAHAGYYAKKKIYEPSELPKGTPHALSNAIGSAITAKIEGKKHHTYCIITDAETSWEEIMLAGKQKLNNITLIIDRNNMEAEGYLDIEPLRQKIEAFGWEVIEVDGHNTKHLTEALNIKSNKPTAIIAHTIPGKGTFMENNTEWYDKKPTKEEAEKAMNQI
ncbi:hypothetical protein KY309_01740 [Candidatus Woesearchaeota archaeon]|nr:hypothetical protein [Candidatus Woesearchaeota archaeon]MBW3016311.1 hypothetical protein [Candidatus Woesearchaeota archaeon]